MVAPRQSARATQKHRSAGKNAGRTSLVRPRSTDAADPDPPLLLLPTKFRHIEAAIATLLWVAFLPAMFFVANDALNCVILVLVVGLMLHAYTMRPFCVEWDEQEEEVMMMEVAFSSEAKSDNRNSREVTPEEKQHQEEWKLVGLLIVLLSTVGSIIAFTMGGTEVLKTWMSPTVNDCSVADLGKLQGDYSRFHCRDGFVDLAQQRSMMTKGGTLVKTYTDYRIAPVYKGRPSKGDLPVAWTVSKNLKLTEAACGDDGLCGIFSSMDAPSDQASYKALKSVARDAVIEAGATDKFDQDSIPVVILTSLSNPEGKAPFFYVGAFFYVAVLLGLLNLQRHMLAENASKLDNEAPGSLRSSATSDQIGDNARPMSNNGRSASQLGIS